jgi:uncharacterized protein YbaA (DUF1428 family)
MRYVDGFLIPVPKKDLRAYRRIAQAAGKIWKKMGALEYVETAGDDLAIEKVVPFTKASRAKRGETVVFSWIVYRSRAHRDQVNAKVMKHPTIVKMMKGKSPIDMKRMAYGGFKTLVDL